MSFTESSNPFQNLGQRINDKEIAKILGQTLQAIFPDGADGIKVISKDIGADPRTVWNWYNGLNTPSLANLILLAGSYPSMIKALLRILGRIDIWEGYERQVMMSETELKKYEISQKNEFYSDIFVGMNLSFNIKLNQRQLWFIKRLQLGLDVKTLNIVKFWNVSARTAERDISVLINYGIIKFVGSKKKGIFKLNIKK